MTLSTRWIGFILGLLVLVAIGAGAPAALASTTTINFDSFSAGNALTTVGTATFVGSPTVFVPVHVATESAPNALHAAQSCSASPTTCYSLEVDFSTPQRAVSVRIGLDDEEAGEFPVPYQLTAYDSGGSVVARSDGSNTLEADSYTPITTLASIQSVSTNVAKVVISTGATSVYPYNSGYARRIAIDDLTFSDDSTAPPPAPVVAIDSPSSGTAYDRLDQPVFSGHVTASAGVSRFCLTTAIAATIPADCSQLTSLHGESSFTNVPVAGLHGGDNTVTAWVEDTSLQVGHSAPVTIHVDTPDLALSNIEVTQATQAQLPVVMSSGFSGPRAAVYNGVNLITGKSTVVRVWVGAQLDGGRPVPGVRVILTGTRDGVPLPGGPLLPLEGTRDVTAANSVGTTPTTAQWADPNSSFTFRLPTSWAGGTISLQAVVNPPGYTPSPNECDSCAANNTMTLDTIPFFRPRTVTVTPVSLLWHNSGDGNTYGGGDLGSAFSATATVSPFTLVVRPYQAVIDISSIGNSSASDDDKNTQAFNQVANWDRDNASDAIGGIIGVNSGVARGYTTPVVFCCDPPRINPISDVEQLRPLTSVAHEFYHQQGFLHAGSDCAGAGGFLGLFATSWPPDHMGLLHGIGTDTRVGSGGAGSPLKIYGMNSFDFMSYCASIAGNGIPGNADTGVDGGDAWISPVNWNLARNAALVHPAEDPLAADASVTGHPGRRGPVLHVFSILPAGGGAARVLSLEAGVGTSSPSSHAGGAKIDVVGTGGKVLSSTSVRLTAGHVNRGGTFEVASATVPAPGGAKSLQIVEGHKVLARRSRPRHVPKVRLLAPKRGAKLRGTGTTSVRWAVRDPDHVRLVTSIDYSANRGRTWRTVAQGIARRRFALPNSLLAHSAHGRLRVRVSDGWNQGTARSGLLKVTGAKVQATVTDPLPGATVSADATVVLRGSGVDDSNELAPGRELHWYEGKRLLGTGSAVTVADLTPGMRSLKLIVRSRDGRTGTTRVPIRVRAAVPAVITRDVPDRVSPRARSVRLRLAATVAGTLRVGAQHFTIARRPKTMQIHIRPGSAPVVLRLRLRAGGGRSQSKLAIRR